MNTSVNLTYSGIKINDDVFGSKTNIYLAIYCVCNFINSCFVHNGKLNILPINFPEERICCTRIKLCNNTITKSLEMGYNPFKFI